MTKGLFITGTDTGVGKTMVSAAIICLLKSRGMRVGAMKPFESGCACSEDRRQRTEARSQKSEARSQKSEVRKGKEAGGRESGGGSQDKTLIPADGVFLREMAEMDDPIDLITPVRLEHPLAPMVAAELEGVSIALERVLDAYRQLSEKYGFMVVEGAGGLLVPLSRKGRKVYYISDLIRDLGLPVIITARPSLGTINQTLLTVHHALKEGLSVRGVVINYTAPPEGSVAEKTNHLFMKELCPVPLLGALPFTPDRTPDAIEAAAREWLDYDTLLPYS
ncbi:MAG: dethiobiotin synthase [Nitrospirales bacterium]|nr:dethiobiotin synthase [Nitrospirales bacterium]